MRTDTMDRFGRGAAYLPRRAHIPGLEAIRDYQSGRGLSDKQAIEQRRCISLLEHAMGITPRGCVIIGLGVSIHSATNSPAVGRGWGLRGSGDRLPRYMRVAFGVEFGYPDRSERCPSTLQSGNTFCRAHWPTT